LPINVEKHLHNVSKIAQGIRYLYVTVADIWKRISMIEVLCLCYFFQVRWHYTGCVFAPCISVNRYLVRW